MKRLWELIRAALPETLGALIATAVLWLLGRLWQQDARPETLGALIVAAALVLLGWLLWWLVKNGPTDEGRKKGRYALFIACYAILVIATWNEVVGPLLSDYLVDPGIDTLIHSHRWITYDPLHFDPSLFPNPEVDSMSEELGWIRDAGFDGIITFTSQGTFSMLPELAKERGFSVIMGVWDPTDRQEVAAAISKRDYVDAYCVGHNGLGQFYSYNDLAKAIRYIRSRTRHPVSTTEKLRKYLDDKRLLEIGDWVFPDSHVSIKAEGSHIFLADAIRDGAKTFDMAKLIAAQEERNGKPILLKMVTYPMSGISNASLEEQAYFFFIILEPIRDSMSDWPSDVSISVHSAFDMPWKTAWPFYEWDPYTGLLDNDGTPRPAVQEIVRRLP